MPSLEPSPPDTRSAPPVVVPSPASPAASPPLASLEPSSSPRDTSADAFRFGDVLAVTVDGLAVREGPSPESARLHGFRVVGVPTAEDLGELSLGPGDFVSVELGPLPVGDATWYLVRPAENGEVGFSTVSWRPAGADGGSYPGWIASAVGAREHVELHRRPDASEIVGGGDPMMAGSGDAVSEPQPRHDLFSLHWAVAPTATPCRLIIQLVPEANATAYTAVDIVTSVTAQSALAGADLLIEPPWGEPAANDWDAYAVAVRSACPWALRLMRLEHD